MNDKKENIIKIIENIKDEETLEYILNFIIVYVLTYEKK